MLSDDRLFLVRERQLGLLRDAAADRLARQIPRTSRPSARERLGSVLIALAMQIAPSLEVRPHAEPFVPTGSPDPSPSTAP